MTNDFRQNIVKVAWLLASMKAVDLVTAWSEFDNVGKNSYFERPKPVITSHHHQSPHQRDMQL